MKTQIKVVGLGIEFKIIYLSSTKLIFLVDLKYWKIKRNENSLIKLY